MANTAQTPERPVKVGDTIYVVRGGNIAIERPCRVCNGDKRVTLILGTGEHVSLDCEYCARGYGAPTGREEFYEWHASAVPYPVTGIEVVATASGEKVRYRSGTENAYSSFDAENCFASPEDASARCAELDIENAAEHERKMRAKENGNKSYAWHAGYHMREAKRAHEQAAYHERKAVLMKGASHG